MGLFQDFRDYNALERIRNNGLPNGSGGDVCERCKYRMIDPRVSYFACATHKIHVGADQVCRDFSRGSPLYQLK